MHRSRRRSILLCHTGIPQDTVLPLLQTRSATITRIKEQVLPTAATITPESVLMAWRADAICKERERALEELILNVTVFVVRVWDGQYREELILNVTVLVVRVWDGQYREELTLNVTVLVVRVWGGQYREELILNVTVFVVRVWGGQHREELILNVTVFVVRFWRNAT